VTNSRRFAANQRRQRLSETDKSARSPASDVTPTRKSSRR
jgi:hypothetical protein